jgi:tetratricopeptide (TPR) repeat protein
MSGMAAGMAALSGLSLYAFTQRDAAIVARNDAVKARENAVTARDDAEEIIEHILTDLKADLEGFGTLKSVTAIGNRAIGYYEGQDVKALTPDQLGRRARVLLMLGEADNKRGNLDAALARYKTAEATTSEQLARDPENAQRIFDHAQSVFWVGYIAWQRGDRAKAKTQFTEYHRLAQRLVAIDPINDDWQAELEYAFSNLGTLAMDDGDAAEAEAWFRKALAVSLDQLNKDSRSLDRILAAEQAYAWLSDALYAKGNYAEAAQVRETQYSIYLDSEGRLLPGVDRSALTSQFSLAQAQLALGQLDKAVANARQAATRLKKLAGSDKDNADLADVADFAQIVLAEAEFHNGQVEAASETLQLVAEKFDGGDLGTTVRQAEFRSQALLLEARLKFRENPSGAASILTSIIDGLRANLSGPSSDSDLVRRYCAALAYRGRLNMPGKQDEADWLEIVTLLKTHGGKLSAASKTLLIEAQYKTGDKQAAVENAESLYATGYRHPNFIELLDTFPELATTMRR